MRKYVERKNAYGESRGHACVIILKSAILIKKHKHVRREMRGCLHPYIRAVVFGVMARWAYNAKGLPVEYNRKSEGWDWVFL